MLQVSVPSVIQAGEGAALLCDVDMENERLYSVKWYKDDELQSVEFFRFVPRETPQLIVYDLPGINVNVSQFIFFLTTVIRFFGVGLLINLCVKREKNN